LFRAVLVGLKLGQLFFWRSLIYSSFIVLDLACRHSALSDMRLTFTSSEYLPTSNLYDVLLHEHGRSINSTEVMAKVLDGLANMDYFC